MLNVFVTPGEVFEELKASPVKIANWIVPVVLLTIVGWIGLWLAFSQPTVRYQLQQMTEKAMQKQLAHMSEADADRIRQYGEVGIKINAALMPVFLAWVTPFWWGLVVWLLGKFVFKANFSYLKALEANGLIAMIMTLDAVIRTLLIIVTGSMFAAPSLILLVKDFDPQNLVHSLLGLVNIMIFWSLAVRAIALARLSGGSTVKAAVWVFGIWFAYMGAIIGIGHAVQVVMARVQGR